MSQPWTNMKSWLTQFAADLRASTDAGLLGLARYFGLLYGPIDASLPIDQALRKSLRYRLAPHVGWRHALGGIAYLLFLLMVVTGVLLVVYYRPSAQEAFPSIQHIVSGVTLGWLIRDVHVWSASLLVIVVLAHMARVFFAAAYRPPRETNWLIGVLLLVVVLAFGITGYLLAWDQSAYWTVTGALNAFEEIPLIGGLTVGLLRGDPIVSGATLSRFFAGHVVILPWFAMALLGFHFRLLRRHGVAPPSDHDTMTTSQGRLFFPNHLLRSFMVGILALAIVITLAILFPRPLGVQAQPGQVPVTILSTWVVVDVSRALVYYTGGWGFALFSLLGLLLAALPLFDRGTERDLRRRPAATAIGLAFFFGFFGLWVAGRGLRTAVLERPSIEVSIPDPTIQPPSPVDSVINDGGRP